MSEPIEAYPLSWPEGWPRRNRWQRNASKYEVTFLKARDELVRELALGRCKHVVVSTNVPLRRDGIPLAGQREPEDPGVAVYWTDKNSKPRVIFCGLNPSTADETEDDPTIRREVDFARRWGFGRLVKVNAYAWRSTDPKGLWSVEDPRGADNFLAIKAHCFDAMRKREGGLFLAAWGNNIRDQDSGDLLRALRFEGIKVYVLKITKRCHPGHPLYLPKTAWPFERATGEPWVAPWPLPEGE